MKPVAARLSELLGQPVKMAKDVVGRTPKPWPLPFRTRGGHAPGKRPFP